MLNLLPAKVQKTARDLQRRVQDTHKSLVGVSQPSVTPEAVPFLDPIDEIVEESPPRMLFGAHYIVVAMFLSLLFVTAVVKVDVVVAGAGRVSTVTPPIVMQAIERAIIRELPIKAGDVVTKGEVLATLDPTFAQADLSSLTAQQRTFTAQVKRLEAEEAGEVYDPGESPNADEVLQKSLFDQRQAQYASRIRIFDEEIARRKANARTTDDHRISQAKQLEIAKDVEHMRSEMAQKQVGSKLNLLEAQASRMRIEQDLTDTVNRSSEVAHDLQSKDAERQAFIDEWRHQILDQLITARTELTKISESASKASLLKDLVVLTAPEDGVVLEVIRRGVGSVVREAEPIVTMVQSNATLEGDITINSADIGYVQAGDQVVVKVDAFPYQRHGFLHGKLVSVSEESFSTNSGTSDGVVPTMPMGSTQSGAFHRGRVSFDATTLEDMPEGARLIPGMTLRAEIRVGARSVLSFFLSPITRVFGESIREP